MKHQHTRLYPNTLQRKIKTGIILICSVPITQFTAHTHTHTHSHTDSHAHKHAPAVLLGGLHNSNSSNSTRRIETIVAAVVFPLWSWRLQMVSLNAHAHSHSHSHSSDPVTAMISLHTHAHTHSHTHSSDPVTADGLSALSLSLSHSLS